MIVETSDYPGKFPETSANFLTKPQSAPLLPRFCFRVLKLLQRSQDQLLFKPGAMLTLPLDQQLHRRTVNVSTHSSG